MKEITQLPLCYSFSFDSTTMTLFLKLQKWLAPQIRNRLEGRTFLMEYMYKTYGGDKTLFCKFGEKGQSFGWGNAILWDRETADEIIYSYALTSVVKQTEEVCDKCNGTKIDFLDHPCHDCHETGKKYVQSERHFSQGLLSFYPIIRFANMTLLESCIEKSERTWHPNTTKKQIVAMEWSDTTGMHNCSMVGWIDDSVAMWIKKVPDDKVKAITIAMKKVEEVLLLRKTEEYYFRFELYNDDLFGFQVPGNACTLGTSSHGMGMFGSVGKTLQPHNVDNRFQQIEFIVGLAVMNDLFEEAQLSSRKT